MPQDQQDVRILELEKKVNNLTNLLSSILQNSTATKIYFKNQVQFDPQSQVGFYGVNPIKRPSAPTADLTLITHTAPSADDFAFANTTNSSPWGFSNQNEANTLLKVVKALQVNMTEVKAILSSLGLSS